MSAEPGRFIRTKLKLDFEYTMVRNWWLRDQRIVGNPLSLYLFLLSHNVNYEITLERARKALGLGSAAFSSARHRLEDAGFLERVVVRYAAGAVDAEGNKLAGRIQRHDIHVLDPERPVATAQTTVGLQGRTREDSRTVPTEEAPVDNFVAELVDGSVQPVAVDSGQEKSCSEPQSGFPHVGNQEVGNQDVGNPLLKEEDQLKEENQSSSVGAIAEPPVDNARPVPAEDDEEISSFVDGSGGAAALFERLLESGVEASLREVDARLVLSEIRRRLELAGVDPSRVDIPAAAAQSLFASARPVGDPSAYVAIAVIREPGRWPSGRALQSPQVKVQPGRRLCETEGHKYLDQWRAWCVRCDQERDGWRDERDGHPAAKVVVQQ